ncbi:MAG TPA: YCF48-related protein, partial [Usitatibacter sp.]|nr:YCF48-related protein [Usitatibacter sp.]
MEGKRLLAAAALLLFCAAAISLAIAAMQGFEPEAAVRRVDRLGLIALTRAGDRLVAAGERGRIVLSRDSGATWQVASTPTFNTLTSLSFVDAKTGFATGHQGVLLRTVDGGETWQQMALAGKEKPALFAVRVEGARGIAVGAYGAYFESADGGITWTPRHILDNDFDRHLAGLAACGRDCLVIAGEAGTIVRSEDA